MSRIWLVPLVVILCALPLFFIDRAALGFLPDPLFALGHLAFFTLLAFACARSLQRTRLPLAAQAGLVLAGAFVLGGAIELLQPFFGRTALWRDVWQNVLGAATGLLLAHPRTLLRSAWALPVFAALLLEVRLPALHLWDEQLARRHFPVLSDFETRLEHLRWSKGHVSTETSRTGSRALRVDLEPGRRWPGTALRRGLGAWSGYEALEFSIHNPEPEPLRLTVSVRDREHGRRGSAYRDRFNRRFDIATGWHDLRIPVAEIAAAPAERTLDVDDIEMVLFFTAAVDAPRTFHLDAVRLTRAAGQAGGRAVESAASGIAAAGEQERTAP